MSMPTQKPHQSEQVVCTPPELLKALKIRLSIAEFAIDLAASSDNAVTSVYYTEAQDALIQPWAHFGWGFCNPPFADLGPWVEKGWNEIIYGAQTCMLVPASVGSNWWRDFVDRRAHVLFLNPRVTFVGHKTAYPKDIAILLYTSFVFGGYEVFEWKGFGDV